MNDAIISGFTAAVSPAVSAISVTPHNTNDLSQVVRGLYVGVSGDVKLNTQDGTTITLGALASGVVHPIRVKRVWSTGTTATGIVGLI